VCTPQNPNCEECPLAGDCRAFAESKLVNKGKPVEYDIEDSDGILLSGALTHFRNLRFMFLIRDHQNGSRKVDLNALPTENLKEGAAGTKSDQLSVQS
jgi:adenine-specific DNA glycosylase